MKKNGDEGTSRRAFFINAARVGIVGSVIAAGAVLLSRVKPASAVNCERRSVCDICSDVFTCTRPEAKGVKAALARERAVRLGVKR